MAICFADSFFLCDSDTASFDADTISFDTDIISFDTDTISFDTDTISFDTGKSFHFDALMVRVLFCRSHIKFWIMAEKTDNTVYVARPKGKPDESLKGKLNKWNNGYALLNGHKLEIAF